MAGNLLEAVPEQLYRLAKLRKLCLYGNKLRSLPDGIQVGTHRSHQNKNSPVDSVCAWRTQAYGGTGGAAR